MTTTLKRFKNLSSEVTVDDVFSESEKKALAILKNKKMTIAELAKEFFKGKKHLNPNNSVGALIRRINSKCKFYAFPWKIDGEGMGRGGRTVWKANLD